MKLLILAALAATVAAVAGIAAASPAVTKQRIALTSRSDVYDSFVLTPLTRGPLARDSGTASACCWSRRFVQRDGQKIEIDDPLKTFTGQRGTFVYRARIEWVDPGNDYSVGTGTWRILRGTGAYERLEGHGRVAVILAPGDGGITFRSEGLVDLKSGSRKPSAAGLGPKIVFVRTTFKPYQAHLFVVNPDGSGLRQLTYGNGVDGDYSWSPDGRRIVFTRWLYGRGGADLFSVGAGGGGLRRLTRTGLASAPSWSPDGRTIVYEDAPDPSLGRGLWLVSPDGSDARSLKLQIGAGAAAQPKDPTWAPDGKSIAFYSAGAVVIGDLEGRIEGRIAPEASRYVCPDWSPDGRRIAFVDVWNGSIFVDDLQNGSEQRVAVRAGGLGFAWSPDSRRIVYSGEKLNGVHAVGVDGTNDVRLTPNSVSESLPVGGLGWSRDGRVVYASDRTGRGDIYLVNARGGGERQLTSGPGIDGAPSWSRAADTGACGGLPKK